MDIAEIIRKMTTEQKIRLCTGKDNWQTQDDPALGIPSLRMSDGTNGVRFQKGGEEPAGDGNLYEAMVGSGFDSEQALANTYPATCFPSGAALACSWDPALAREVGAAVARECKGLGIGLLLGPGMNIRRHPLTARNFEYYSEDPVLAGDMAAGMVDGIQGEGVGATVKHFICNNSDTRRTALNLKVEPRALREIYLAGFERVVKKAKPAAVMGSYPAVNGRQCCEDEWLLTTVLRDEWGFQGMVLSDWGGVKDSESAAVAGLDLQMPMSNQYIEQVQKALQDGRITEAQLDAHCERILRAAFTYGRKGDAPQVDWEKHHLLARRAAAECGVLLKNGGALPLPKRRKLSVAVLGEAAVRPVFQGTGCAVVNAMRVDSPLEALKAALPLADIQYAPGYLADYSTTDALLREAARLAERAEVAILVVASRLPLESDDYDRPNMELESGHRRLIESVCGVQPNTVVVVCNGDAVEMPLADQANAILDMWYAGEGAGQAMADLLTGDLNPCGKLAVTIPKRLADCPAYLDFPHEQDAGVYREGIFVGYRWYDARRIEPMFPFGHGLSYTRFRYDHIQAEAQGDGYAVRVTLTNVGRREGSEIVQLYVKPPEGPLFRPERELKAFAKVSLKPGEQKTVALALETRDFACFDDHLNAWRVMGGEYILQAGGSSRCLPLEARVWPRPTAAPVRQLTADSHYTDVFRDRRSAVAYFDFLVEHGLLRADQVTPELERELSKTFWGFSQHLDMLAGNHLTQQMLAELLNRMNRALAEG